MIKRLCALIFGIFLSSHCLAEIKIRWLSVASIYIEDGESSIMFDPDWTRPRVIHALGLSELRSDTKLVQSELEKLNIKSANAVFTSHSHFDHAIDAPIVARLTNAINYVDQSSLRISNAYKDPRIKTQLIKSGESIQIGRFQVTPMKREHSEIGILGMHFLPGEVPKDFNFNFWDYRTGDTWFYLIEHPERTILIEQGSATHLDLMTKIPEKVDVLIQGIANRENDEVFISGYLTRLKPKIFIPLHFDNFFKDFDPESMGELFGIKTDSLLENIEQTIPEVRATKPKYGEVIIL